MKKDMPSNEKLQEILAFQKYEDLEPYQQKATWKGLNSKDKESLASLFILRGEKQLEQSDKNGIESFNIALRIIPNNPDLYFRIGCAYAAHDDNRASLKLAEETFLKASSLNENHLEAKLALGKVYVCLGKIEEQEDYFEKANDVFEATYKIFKNSSKEQLSVLFRQWGNCWYFSGKLSGETADFLNALDKFRQAAELGSQNRYFWIDYGHLFMELGYLLNKNDLYLEAVECYRESIRLAFDFFEGWLHLARAYRRIFECIFSEDYFNQADECFKMASQLQDASTSTQLWFSWGNLLFEAGKIYRDLELIRDSITKLEKAHLTQPHDVTILCQWSQALIFFGVQTENINKIYEGRQKTLQALQNDPDDPESWFYYGISLIELGKYFSDEEYYHLAIEKLTHALILNENESRLYYGLGLAHYCLGELDGNVEHFEKAADLFTKSKSLNHYVSRQFWNDWGVVLMKLAELTHDKNHVFLALEKFDKALGDDRTESLEKAIDPEWLYNCGCAWDFLGEFQEDADCYEHAIAALTKVLDMDPFYTFARYNLALAYAHFGEIFMDVESFHKSIEHFQVLLSQDPEDEMGWNDYGVTLIHLSQLIYDKTCTDQAMALYELAESKLLQSAALGNIQSYYNLACLYSLMNKQSYAMHFLEKAHDAETIPSLKELIEDEWLDNIKMTTAFRNFINQISSP